MKSSSIAVILLSLLLVPSAAAQTDRASIRGTVTDPNKAVVPGAVIKIVNNETGEERSVSIGTEGNYAISSLPPAS